MARRSLYSIVKPHLILSQACGLFPVSCVVGSNSSKLRFKWFSPLVVYSLGLWLFLVASFVESVHISVKAHNQNVVTTFYANIFKIGGAPLLVTPIFWMISLKWYKFIEEWETIEEELEDVEVKLTNVYFSIMIATQVVMLAVLDGTSLYDVAMCLEGESLWQVIQMYYTLRNPLVFHHFSLGPLASCMVGFFYEAVITLQWICAPLLISGISLVIASRLHHLNNQLEVNKGEVRRPRQWRMMRETYSKLSQLTRLADDLLNKAIMITCFTEVYFVIIYVYLALVSIWTAQGLVITCVGIMVHSVTGGLCLLSMMDVHEESKRPLSVLNAVPYQHYVQEVSRFYDQVSIDFLALTCGNFFHITRPVLLTILSTILTYELALTQFSDSGQIDTVKSREEICSKNLRPLYQAISADKH